MAFKSHLTSDEYRDHMEKLFQQVELDHKKSNELVLNAPTPSQCEQVIFNDSFKTNGKYLANIACSAHAELRKTATHGNGHQTAPQGTKPTRGRNKGEIVLAALLTSASVPDVAAHVGCSIRTVYRYLGDESFKRMYAEAKARLLDEAILKLRNASGQAVDTLIEVCRDQYAPVPCRVAAARSIVQLAIQAGQVEELEQRLQLVEMNTIEGIAAR